jgi:tetratricopeptide (TPR) repeat protein
MHITVELIDGRNAAVLWGPTSYDRSEADLQVTADAIAGAIVQDAVRLKLSPENRTKLALHTTNDGEADRLYRLALLHLDKETKDDYLTARSLLRQAVERDGKFALAYLALAFTYSSMAIDGYESPAEALLQNKLYANMALQLDSTIVEAHAQLGTELFWGQWKWREAEREFTIAASSPGAPVYEPYVYLLWATRRPDEALTMIRHALQENPVSLKWRLREADLLLARSRADEAERAYREVIRDNPEDQRAYLGMAQVKRKQKQFADAIGWLRRGYELAGETDPRVVDLLKHAQDERGFVEIVKREAQLELDYLRNVPSTQYVSPLDFARAYARLGDRNQTFRYVDLAFEEHSPGLAMLNVDSAWELVRDDMRFDNARKRVGLP